MRSRIQTTRALGALLLALAAACGGGGDDDGGDDGAGPDADLPDHAVLRRASKSGTIAMTGDDAFVVMVNPETDSVSVFDAATGERTAVAITGDEPSAVVIHPDDT